MAAARRGKWIDQSQSLNVFSATVSGKRLSDIYLYAWRLGLKTTYYLRTLGASGIEKSTVSQIANSIKVEMAEEPLLAIATAPVAETLPPLAMAAAEVGASVYNVGPVCEACQ